MTLEDEHQLLQDIKRDPKRFGVLFDLYYNDIFGYIFRRLANYEQARDIAAETFLKGMLRIGSFEWKGIHISSWLYRIASNEVNQYFRHQRLLPISFNRVLDHYDLKQLEQASDAQEKQQLEDELKAHKDFIEIRKLLIEQDVKYQEVIALRFFESKSIRDISEILEKKEGTIKSLLSRGMEQIRIAMNATKTDK